MDYWSLSDVNEFLHMSTEDAVYEFLDGLSSCEIAYGSMETFKVLFFEVLYILLKLVLVHYNAILDIVVQLAINEKGEVKNSWKNNKEVK